MKKLYVSLMCCCLVTLLIFCLTACGSNRNNNPDEVPSGTDMQNTDTSEQMDSTGQTSEGTAGLGEDIADAGEAVVDGAEDLIDGAEDAVEDLLGIDFTDYNSSHDYLLGQLDPNAPEGENRYEVREKEKTSVSYDRENPDKKAYRYEVYDTTSDADDEYGVFYVDQETGMIYREDDETDEIKEYHQK